MSKSNSALHVGTAQLVESRVKQIEADTLRADIEAFLAKGGKIQKLGNTPVRGITAPPKRKRAKPLAFARKKPSKEPTA